MVHRAVHVHDHVIGRHDIRNARPECRGIRRKMHHVELVAACQYGQKTVLPGEPERPDLTLWWQRYHDLCHATIARKHRGVQGVGEEKVVVGFTEIAQRIHQLGCITVEATSSSGRWNNRKQIDTDAYQRPYSRAWRASSRPWLFACAFDNEAESQSRTPARSEPERALDQHRPPTSGPPLDVGLVYPPAR